VIKMTTEPNFQTENQKKEVVKMKPQPVLIVEDEAIMRESLRDWLTESGYQVATAEDGEQALQMVAERDFGIAVLDLKLPGKDGLEVLREAKEQRPRLKGIIITAYPSVETAVEAMRLGAIDYLPKPFAPDALEKLIQQTLGPVQMEIRPQAAVEIAEEVEQPKVEVEEVVTITEAEVPAHLEQGKEQLKAGHFDEAVREFQVVLGVAPGNIEARVLLHQAREEAAKPRVEGEAAIEEAVKPCVWMKLGVVSFRICTRNYDCLTCEFDQKMQEQMAAEEAPELAEALEQRKRLPGNQRLCRYALTGDISYRLCARLFQCATCEFGQMMQDALDQKLAKLAARREALRKKEERAKA
jgi:DNA-binding response OmpR family regulator